MYDKGMFLAIYGMYGPQVFSWKFKLNAATRPLNFIVFWAMTTLIHTSQQFSNRNLNIHQRSVLGLKNKPRNSLLQKFLFSGNSSNDVNNAYGILVFLHLLRSSLQSCVRHSEVQIFYVYHGYRLNFDATRLFEGPTVSFI